MQMKMYAVYDKKAKAYMTPFFQHNNAMAQRAFEGSCKNPDSMMKSHPEDFSLWYLGEFEDTTGEIGNDYGPENICDAVKIGEEV